MQQKETLNTADLTDVSREIPPGRIVGLDIGTKRVGVAICDEMRITVRPLSTIDRTSWKKLLTQTKNILAEYDAAALVIGLPYNFDGSESEMSAEARRVAGNFSLSLDRPVFLQDERVSSYEAKGRLWARGAGVKEAEQKKDAEAAAIILQDFLDRLRAARPS
jgi:putative Holliday junction resolvase